MNLQMQLNRFSDLLGFAPVGGSGYVDRYTAPAILAVADYLSSQVPGSAQVFEDAGTCGSYRCIYDLLTTRVLGDEIRWAADSLGLPKGEFFGNNTCRREEPPIKFIAPLEAYERIHSGYYDYRASFNGLHEGIDLVVPQRTPVYAIAPARVMDIRGNDPSGGGMVYLDHGSGYFSRYLHLSKILVLPRQCVAKGDMIALSGGAKGTYGQGKSDGPHLHFDMQMSRDQIVKWPEFTRGRVNSTGNKNEREYGYNIPTNGLVDLRPAVIASTWDYKGHRTLLGTTVRNGVVVDEDALTDKTRYGGAMEYGDPPEVVDERQYQSERRHRLAAYFAFGVAGALGAAAAVNIIRKRRTAP